GKDAESASRAKHQDRHRIDPRGSRPREDSPLHVHDRLHGRRPGDGEDRRGAARRGSQGCGVSKISIPDESWREDEEYDLMVQRDVDDRWEEEVKTLLDAFVDGRQAGRELLS